MMRRFEEVDNRVLVAVVILVFIFSRIVIRFWLGFSPDPSILENHWQHADLRWLHERFWETILYLHSQPPVWNAAIGGLTQLVGPDPEAVARAISLIYGMMSLAMMLVFVGFARCLGFARLTAAVIGLLIALSPTMIYYENYPFYPHFTAFLVTGLFLAAVRLENNTLAPLFALFAIAAVLSLTWAVFHPVFITLLGALCLVMYSAARSLKGLAIIVAAAVLSYAPTLKNDALFGQDFASSWLGINLMQTLPNRDEQLMEYCKFETVVDALVTGQNLAGVEIDSVGVVSVDAKIKPSSGEANMNNILVSKRAEECLGIYFEKAPQDPAAHLAHVGGRMIASHSMLPFIYAFRPTGWDSRVWVERAYYKFGSFSKAASLSYYLVLIAYLIWRIRRGGDRRVYILTLFIITYFTLVTHLANGIEQQRMRATIEPLYWFALISLMSDIKAGLTSRSR